MREVKALKILMGKIMYISKMYNDNSQFSKKHHIQFERKTVYAENIYCDFFYELPFCLSLDA